MKKILITGGSGFIGCHLARALLARKECQLTLADNLSRGALDDDLRELLGDARVRLVEVDLAEPGGWAGLGEGYDEVYHLAAVIGVKNVLERPWEVVRVNALATVYLLDWFRAGGGKKLLFSSTSEAYAWTRLFYEVPVPTPERVPLALTDVSLPRSSYAGSKIFGELAMAHGCGGRPHVVVRYHNVYGPRMGWQHVIPELLVRLEGGENPLRVFSPDHTRAFCYVDDAVEATILAMESELADGQTFHVGNEEEEITVRELAGIVQEASGRKVEMMELEAAHDPITRRCPSTAKLRELLGYSPKTSLWEGVAKTAAWYLPRIRRGEGPQFRSQV